jgi:hypothetical protein
MKKNLFIIFSLFVTVSPASSIAFANSNIGVSCTAVVDSHEAELGDKIEKIALDSNGSGFYKSDLLGGFQVQVSADKDPSRVLISILQTKDGKENDSPSDSLAVVAKNLFARTSGQIDEKPVQLESLIGRIGIMDGGTDVMIRVSCQKGNTL